MMSGTAFRTIALSPDRDSTLVTREPDQPSTGQDLQGYEPNGPRGQQYLHCKVCNLTDGSVSKCCDVCGEMVHERCAVGGRGFAVCNLCYDGMLVQYGHQRLAQQEWLQQFFLRRAREQRLHEQQLTQVERASYTGDVVESIASTTGALIGGGASSSAKGAHGISQRSPVRRTSSVGISRAKC